MCESPIPKRACKLADGFDKTSEREKKMGGMGSGGWNGSGRATVEEVATLSMSTLRARGALKPGAHTVWTWSRNGQPFASISVHGGCDSLRLSYSLSTEGGPQRRIDDRVSLERRPCRFGGARAFFLCPRCGRSVLNLHLRAGRFTCRECARLTYASRRERERDRHLRAANKLRERLGGEAGALNLIAERPKRMWRRTYARIVAEIERRECFATEELAGWMMKIARGRGATRRFW
jgi:hypothetical protein